MDVIRRHQFEAEFPGPRDEVPIDLGLLRNAVILQFEIKIVGSKRLFEPINRFFCFGQLVFDD